eukprot:NODE_7878_length_1542_cov_3.952650.p1 GENE.NODE_7878_length_1542_cov_3.952650~~NODE_7878_length_1542_cov_3.952650.p1  ORF type:complete len:418 (+),score=79.46 NODE_7878_length_1542_cov_3.952650:3-1256(+)
MVTGPDCAAELVAAPDLCRELLQLLRYVQRKEPVVAAGCAVQLRGLASAQHLNGRHGCVVRREDPRWIVRLDGDGGEVSVKAENITALALGPGADEDVVAPPAPCWECNGPEGVLRVNGFTRPPREGESHRVVAEIAWRGSRNMENWATNFTVQLTDLQLGNCVGKVHSGFQTAYLLLRDTICRELEQSLVAAGAGLGESVLLYVVGYSLGGALATLAAYELACKFPNWQVRCVTCGSPRVGDELFTAGYLSIVPWTVRFVGAHDVIPRTPSNASDPCDDGPAFSRELTGLLERGRIAGGVGGYYHVCPGTALAQRLEVPSFADATTNLKAGFLSAALNAGSGLLRPHKLRSYVEGIEALLRGEAAPPGRSGIQLGAGLGAAAAAGPAPASEAAAVAAQAVGGLLRFASQSMGARRG